MAHVHIPALLRTATEGREWIEVQGATVRDVVAALESAFPALTARLMKNGRLAPGIVIAIDGEISSLGLSEAITAETEVQFLTAIQGG